MWIRGRAWGLVCGTRTVTSSGWSGRQGTPPPQLVRHFLLCICTHSSKIGGAQVYERSKRYRDCGAGISVQINGMKAIQAVSPDLLEAFEARGCTITRFEELDQNGEKLAFRLQVPCLLSGCSCTTGRRLQCKLSWCAGDQIPGRTPVDTTAFNSDAVKKQHGEQSCCLSPSYALISSNCCNSSGICQHDLSVVIVLTPNEQHTAASCRLSAKSPFAGVKPAFYGWSNIQQVRYHVMGMYLVIT